MKSFFRDSPVKIILIYLLYSAPAQSAEYFIHIFNQLLISRVALCALLSVNLNTYITEYQIYMKILYKQRSPFS